MALSTDSTRFDLKYATIPASDIPTKVGINISDVEVNIPLTINILNDVYGINSRNFFSFGFSSLLVKNNNGTSLGI